MIHGYLRPLHEKFPLHFDTQGMAGEERSLILNQEGSKEVNLDHRSQYLNAAGKACPSRLQHLDILAEPDPRSPEGRRREGSGWPRILCSINGKWKRDAEYKLPINHATALSFPFQGMWPMSCPPYTRGSDLQDIPNQRPPPPTFL